MILDKKYDHIEVEKNKNKKWIDKKFFSNHDLNKKAYSIILPPPNITGKLHLGHAWDSYIQDCLIRYKKLNHYDVLFLPAVDHAGIATQSKIEQKLQADNISKHDLGREKFLKIALSWKEEYYQIIKKQWAKLGLGLDYDSERFTLDDLSNKAVSKVFIDLYNKGLIYKAKKAINWDPKLKTALSNIEVENKETESEMVYIKYFLENSLDYIVIATTRAETLFSDVAVAYNPNDETKTKFKNKKVVHPLSKKIIPIIEDEYIKIGFGTGFMKVSAHATNDIEIINKNKLEIIECIDESGIMNKNALEYEGLTREMCRKKVIQFLEENNFVEKKEKIINSVAYSQRSSEVIEILVKNQWFIKMDYFSKLVLDSLKSKNKVELFPKRFEKVLKRWMEEAYDWTISRQLWWGHRIPAWYKDNEIKVQIESPGKDWVQDEDVLDTWFSSGLAPFSFLGWPENSKKLDKFFPTSLLVTGYDIIFFWVARMYFFSLEFKKNIPFKQILFHGLIRDEKGRKMSKSLGNGIDPIDVINEYGSDSLRWFLLTNSSPGLDINFSNDKMKLAWSINNKLWNISRFILTMEDSNNNLDQLSTLDKWIYNKLFILKNDIDKAMKKYDFTIIGKIIYHFIFKDLSSWYIEFSKAQANKKIAMDVLEKLLIIIHPFLPFISDDLYFKITNKEILDQSYPELKKYDDTTHVDKAIIIINLLRSFRADYNLSNKEIIYYWYENNDQKINALVNKIANAENKKNKSAFYSNQGIDIYILLDNQLIKKQRLIVEQEINKINSEILRSKNILANKNFLAKASKEKIENEKEKFKNYQNKLNQLNKKIIEFDKLKK